MWRGDAGTSVGGTNDDAAGMYHAAERETEWVWDGRERRKEVMYKEREDEE